MLILIGTVPTAYALNRSMPASQMDEFRDDFGGCRASRRSRRPPATTCSAIRVPAVSDYVVATQDQRGTYPSLSVLIQDIARQVSEYGSLAQSSRRGGRQYP